jgi:O-methyltransferase involved in polyketide biosynthesis
MANPLTIGRGSASISPTAHYTGHVWVRNGLSHPALATWEGRALFDALQPATVASRLAGGPTLEGLLLARHRVIDHLLGRAIEDGSIGQVIEPACGMAPRGWRFTERYGDDLTYVEADLPAMAERKRRALSSMGSLSDRHRVAEVDVLSESGPQSLDALAATLDPAGGTAIVTEGLLTYFDQDQVVGMWRRFAHTIARFELGCYFADIRLTDRNRGAIERGFGLLLSGFVRGGVHTHFSGQPEAVAGLRSAGFARARLHQCSEHPAAGRYRRDPGAGSVTIIEASKP